MAARRACAQHLARRRRRGSVRLDAVAVTRVATPRVARQTMMMTQCGTPEFVAPEVMAGNGYTKARPAQTPFRAV